MNPKRQIQRQFSDDYIRDFVSIVLLKSTNKTQSTELIVLRELIYSIADIDWQKLIPVLEKYYPEDSGN